MGTNRTIYSLFNNVNLSFTDFAFHLLSQTSYDKVTPPSLTDLGYDSLVSIYSDLHHQGKSPSVIDSDILREDPEVSTSSQTLE